MLEALLAYCARDYYPFHFPAHKQGRSGRKLQGEIIGYSLDLTELPGLDDLHHPVGPIKQAQDLAAQLAGAYRSYFLVNGSSVGLMAAMLGVCSPGEEVLIPRQCHRSLVSAAIWTGVRPVFLLGGTDARWCLPTGVDNNEIKQALDSHPQIKAIFLVYPTYEGLAYRLNDLISECHRRGLAVVVDQAHGAHFGLHPDFPESALALGADVVVDGWHKTMGSMTQTAIMHLNHGFSKADRVSHALDLLQTTSPSYPLMASLDAARAFIAQQGEKIWAGALQAAEDVRAWLRKDHGFELWEPGGERRLDPLRITAAAADTRVNGGGLAAALREHGGIEVESWGDRHVLLVFSWADTPAAGLLVRQAFASASSAMGSLRVANGKVSMPAPAMPESVITPREAFFAGRIRLGLAEAEGRVAAGPIIPYPPGIPLCWPGELIGGDLTAFLQERLSQGYEIQGINQAGEVAVVST